jgi:hypothetical protein
MGAFSSSASMISLAQLLAKEFIYSYLSLFLFLDA